LKIGSPDLSYFRPYLSLRAIAVATALGLAAMAGLGTFVVSQFRAVQLRDAGDIGSAYIQGFLARYAIEATETGALTPAAQAELRALNQRVPNPRQFAAVQIWSLSGQLLFSSSALSDAHQPDNVELDAAIRGEVGVEVEPATDANAFPLLEIYAPILRPGTNEVIAVGEVYQDARRVLAERRRFERTVIAAGSLATFAYLVSMLMIARQQKALLAALDQARAAAVANERLKQSAEEAWRMSSQSNEDLLNQIGADLQDGPVQMMGLLALVTPTDATGPGPAPKDLAAEVMVDLRRISSGLSLPELKRLTTAEVVDLAVARHINATGTTVDVDLADLPSAIDDQRKTCLYRIVQEGLNNAVSHGGGNGQAVTAVMDNATLVVSIRDDGSTEPPEQRLHRHAFRGLGLQGLRNRLKVFGGTLEAAQRSERGYLLTARLPFPAPATV
jgi:signal transduction histidine kinase